MAVGKIQYLFIFQIVEFYEAQRRELSWVENKKKFSN